VRIDWQRPASRARGGKPFDRGRAFLILVTGDSDVDDFAGRPRRARAVAGLVAVALVLVVVALAVRHRSADPLLSAMKHDALASAVIPGARLVDTSSHAAGTVLGKPVHAAIFRWFLPEGGRTTGDLVTAAVEVAKSSGWVMTRQSSVWRGFKSGVPGGALIATDGDRLIVTLDASLSP
jgi:hypothetical protein